MEDKLISYEDLGNLALKAQGKIKRIFLHWSGGHYEDVYGEYHLSIDGKGNIHQTCEELTEIKAHTYKRNSKAIGIALCCCADANAKQGCNTDFGTEPPTLLQIEVMARVIAILSNKLNLPINANNVITHCEIALEDGYGPYSGDPETKWDLWYLPDLPARQGLFLGGDVLRGKAIWYKQLYFPKESEVKKSWQFNNQLINVQSRLF